MKNKLSCNLELQTETKSLLRGVVESNMPVQEALLDAPVKCDT